MQCAAARYATRLCVIAAAALMPALSAVAQSINPGRDYNQQLYERRYDPGAMSGPTYHPQSPAQQYNQLQYERRYRAPAIVDKPRTVKRLPMGENSPRVRSVKPSRKTDEQLRRARRQESDE